VKAPAYQTCPTCGSVLLWTDGQLACLRRHEDLAASFSRGPEGAKPAAETMGVAAAGDGRQPQQPEPPRSNSQ
jgi:hypothetical protein